MDNNLICSRHSQNRVFQCNAFYANKFAHNNARTHLNMHGTHARTHARTHTNRYAHTRARAAARTHSHILILYCRCKCHNQIMQNYNDPITSSHVTWLCVPRIPTGSSSVRRLDRFHLHPMGRILRETRGLSPLRHRFLPVPHLWSRRWCSCVCHELQGDSLVPHSGHEVRRRRP